MKEQQMFLNVLLVTAMPQDPPETWQVGWNACQDWLKSIAQDVTPVTIAADDAQSPEARAGIVEVVARVAAGEFDRIVFYGERTELASDVPVDVVPPGATRFAGPWFVALIEGIASDHQVPVVDLRPLTSSFS